MIERGIALIEKIMDIIAEYTLIICFTIIFIVGLVIKPMYSFDDSPYFELITGYDICCFVFVACVFAFIVLKRDWIQNKISYKVGFILFALISAFVIWQVPLTPFSDMGAVYTGALNFAKMDWITMLDNDYWNIFPGNIRLSVFWGILAIPFPKTLVTFKVLNACMMYGIILLTRLLAKEYNIKYYNIVYLLFLLFLPFILYVNCVYFDIPLILFCLLGLYVYKRKDNLVVAFIFIGLACFLRKSGQIFMIAIVIDYIFRNKSRIKGKTWIRKAWILVLAIFVSTAISKGAIKCINNVFIKGNYQSYPSWNEYYIGLNEEEFGFQNNDFSYERTAQDVIDRAVGYGPVRVGKILIKKTFWLWGQGTYQAQRYAFGNDVENALDKFEYETIFTKYLLKDTQKTRKLINAFMRAQYYILFGLMIMALYKRGNINRFRLFYYIIIATFLAMLIYELKSRYIFHLLPLMIIIGVDCIDNQEIRMRIKRIVKKR